MLPVRDKRQGPDPTSCRDPIPSDRLIADHADEAGDDNDPGMFDRRGVYQPIDRDKHGIHPGSADGSNDEQAREVLHAAQPVGEAGCRGTTRQTEGEPDRQGSEAITQVVHGVRQQGD